MLKEFLLKKMLEAKLKDLPEDQREKISAAFSKNPELFRKIALEAQEKIKGGKDQMTAMMEVMQAHGEELKKLL